ncbi:MAG TPA: hypothetical protein DIV39_00820 [Verrucomicrobiales bacterium]|nr:hypothetical protein [Verrucomicrobiales bacterium]
MAMDCRGATLRCSRDLLNTSFPELAMLQTFHGPQRLLSFFSQVKITVQLLGQARQLSPSDEIVLNVADGSSVDEIVPVLLDGASDSLRLVLSEGSEALQLRRSVMAIHNDQTIEPATRDLLKDGDALSLLPPMSGG